MSERQTPAAIYLWEAPQFTVRVKRLLRDHIKDRTRQPALPAEGTQCRQHRRYNSQASLPAFCHLQYSAFPILQATESLGSRLQEVYQPDCTNKRGLFNNITSPYSYIDEHSFLCVCVCVSTSSVTSV